MRRRQPEAVRVRRDGDGAGRSLDLHLLRRAQRPRNGLDLSRWLGGAKATLAAADGTLGKNRVLRPDRAAGRVRRKRWSDDDREARGRFLDPERPEAMDRQCTLVRP